MMLDQGNVPIPENGTSKMSLKALLK